MTAADAAVARKRFLTRTARYSGLLNVLTFAELEMSNITALNDVLSGSRAWIVFNVSQENIADYSKAALDADISRVMFTTSLPEEKVNDTVIPEFETAISEFSSKGKSFTGIRHGAVVPGSEDNSYEIVNATTSCVMPTVERGVLARVVAELLCIDESVSKVCGVSSSNAFAAAYLDILRSSGLTRQQEVKKIFTGGIDRVARLTVAKYEEERRIVEEKQAKAEQRKVIT